MDNIVLIDSDLQEAEDFRKGIQSITRLTWEVLVCNSNKPRTNKVYNLLRYCKYFVFPLVVFLQQKRRKYQRIVAWQQFYGIFYSFYLRVFKRKKTAQLTIMTFIYNEKQGIIGKIYERFLQFALANGRYIDVITCTAKAEMEVYAEKFDIPYNKFRFVPWGILDYAKINNYSFDNNYEEFIFSPGRSNRDWGFLIDSLRDEEFHTIIACDELSNDIQGNVEILNDVDVDKSNELMSRCFCVIISIQNSKISAGQTVLMQAMNYGKPVIITESQGLSDDYIIHEYNGLVIKKRQERIASCNSKIKER